MQLLIASTENRHEAARSALFAKKVEKGETFCMYTMSVKRKRTLFSFSSFTLGNVVVEYTELQHPVSQAKVCFYKHDKLNYVKIIF